MVYTFTLMARGIGFTDVIYGGGYLNDALEWWLHLKTAGERWEVTSERELRKLPNNQEFSWQKTALNVFLVFTYILLAPLTLLALLIREILRNYSLLEGVESEPLGGRNVQKREKPSESSPKMCFQTHLLTLGEAKEALINQDSYLRSLTPYDRLVRLGKEASQEEFETFCQNQALEWDQWEKETIVYNLETIQAKLRTLDVVWPQQIAFIKTTGKEELKGTYAYCREGAIIFCRCYHPHLLAHELFHILSQYNPEKREQLYTMLGFEKSRPVQLPENAVLNPDYPYGPYFITIQHEGKEVRGIPVDLIQDPATASFGTLQHRLLLEDGSLIPYQRNPSFLEQVGENTTYTDSPEEILADNFSAWIAGDTVRTPRIQEAMLAILQAP